MSAGGMHRILVVDDDPGLRYTLERILSPLYNVDVVGGAVAARQRLARHSYDLALVDVRLGDGDGYSVCRELRQLRPQTDVILITGSLSEPDEKLYRALEEGAFYFLFKPFDRRVLQALVERCLRLQRERAAKEAHARTLANDLDKARRFQRSLLPAAPVAAAGWHVEGRLRSCDELGGDLFHAQPWDGAGVVFSLSDVVGHGVGAAMVAGMLRSTLDAARRRDPEPAQVARELLAGIDFFEGALCATLIYGLLAADGRLRYANAGHPPLLWHGSAGVRRLGATGTLLHHALRDRPLLAAEVRLASGDRLLVCSDGAFEARNPADQELGLEALEEAFVVSRPLPPAEALETLLATVRRHCAGRPLQDDLTLVLIERTAPGA